MLELFSSDTTIVLGLDLSGDESRLVDSAVRLAKKTGSRLVLVHAVQPFRSYLSSGDDTALSYEPFEQDSYAVDRDEAEETLYALRDQLPPELLIDIKVSHQYPEYALEQVAEELKASLIICGIRSERSERWYGRTSTALSLMNVSKFPVMVLPLNMRIDFTSGDHNILVADNLESEGLYALKAAMGLCKSIAYKQLFHLHVKKTSYRDINETVAKIKLAMIEGRLPSNPQFEAQDYLSQIKKELKAIMHERLQIADKDFSQGLHWAPRVRFGTPIDELQHLVRDSKSDILIFGKYCFI